MRLRSIIFTLLPVTCIILLQACKVTRSDDNNVPVITVDPQANGCKPDEFFDSYSYTVLETNDSALIGRRCQYDIDDNLIVAYSEESGFAVFGKDGKLLKSFDYRGEGPEEYIQVTDMFLHDNMIYVVCGYQHKIVVYNAKDGLFQKRITLPDIYTSATWLDDIHIALCAAYCSPSKHNIAILNTETGEIDNQFLPYKHFNSLTFGSYSSFIGRDDDGVYFGLPFNTDLYYLTSDTCKVVESYTFNTTDKMEPVAMADVNTDEMYELYKFRRCVKYIDHFYAVSEDLHYQVFELLCDQGVLPHICKYNPKTGESKTLRINSVLFDEFPYLTDMPQTIKNGYYIFAKQAEDVLRKDKTIGSTRFTDLGVTEESNPIIFFYHLKEESEDVHEEQLNKTTETDKLDTIHQPQDTDFKNDSIRKESICQDTVPTSTVTDDTVKTSSKTEAEESTALAQLIMYPGEMELGTIHVGDTIVQEFHVGNISDNKCVLSFEPTCDCVSAILKPSDVIDPHESNILEVRFIAKDPKMKFKCKINFVGNIEFQPFFLKITGNIIE